jgi:predicted nucleotidyltransferase
MARPKPSVDSPNQHHAFLRQAQALAGHFATHEGVVGVLLIGGAARGYADHFSELDLAVYLTRPTFEDWIGRGRAPLPESDTCVDGWHVDIDYFCYEEELEAEWEHGKRWDRSYAVILHDPRACMQEMLARKAVLDAPERRVLVRRYLVLCGDYFCSLVVPSWLHRGDVMAAHHCLNLALDGLLKIVFLANEELIPFEKWTLNLSYTLAWTPQSWRERMEQALLVQDMSAADVERRRALIGDLFAECGERLVAEGAGALASIEAHKLEVLRAIRERGEMPASEFDRRFGLRTCLQSPFFHLLRREMREDGEWLVFSEERLEAHAARDFEGFLEWDRALLGALRDRGSGRCPADTATAS